jgi:hypothetical protein
MEADFNNSGDSSRPGWLTALGTCEGFLSLLLTVFVFLVPVSPGTHRMSTIIICTLIGLGMGFGISGIRFGNRAGRLVAWWAVVVLSLLSAVLVGFTVWRVSQPGRPYQPVRGRRCGHPRSEAVTPLSLEDCRAPTTADLHWLPRFRIPVPGRRLGTTVFQAVSWA